MDSNSSFKNALWFESYFHLSVLRFLRILSYWLFWLSFTAFVIVFLTQESAVALHQILLGFSLLLFSYTALAGIIELFGKSLQKPGYAVAKAAMGKNNAELAFITYRTLLDSREFKKAQKQSRVEDFLVEHNLKQDDIERVTHWYRSMAREEELNKKFWLKRNLRKFGSLGKDWASGYTVTLDAFSEDLTKTVQRLNFPKAIAHEKEKEGIARILSRRQANNALIVGEPGSGRNRLLLDFASASILGEHANPRLNYQRVVKLELSSLLASVENRQQAEQALEIIFQEVARAGNVILVIDEFHNFVGGGNDPQAAARLNITGILMSYLRSPNFPLIAVTTYTGLHRYIEHNPSVLSLFEKVEVVQITPDQALDVLLRTVPGLEQIYRRNISYPALKAIIKYSDKYIQTVPLPKKAIDLLDESLVKLVQSGNDLMLLPEHVAKLLSEKTSIPVGEAEESERDILLDLEKLIHQRIVNQHEAVGEIASALRRARADVTTRTGPLGSFLFLGPTGVGKTETAKALAAIYFGSESRMIRLDMSEFQNSEDVARILGTKDQDGLLTTAVREDPFSLVLLDELEKAHPNILNLFLQVLDEGHITDGIGRKIDFRHAMIIATSNAGYQLILQAIRDQKDFAALRQEMLDHLFQEGVFRPEFLNRFDGVILFRPLSRENLLDIAGLMLEKLQLNLEGKSIEFVITQALKERIAELGYDPIFGARSMRRVIQDKVENALARALLAKDIKRGDRITVQPTDFQVTTLQKYTIT